MAITNAAVGRSLLQFVQDSIGSQYASARQAILLAGEAVTQALNEGRTLDLDEARQLWQKAQAAFFANDYVLAKALAEQAMKIALGAKRPVQTSDASATWSGFIDAETITIFAAAGAAAVILAILISTKTRRHRKTA